MPRKTYIYTNDADQRFEFDVSTSRGYDNRYDSSSGTASECYAAKARPAGNRKSKSIPDRERIPIWSSGNASKRCHSHDGDSAATVTTSRTPKLRNSMECAENNPLLRESLSELKSLKGKALEFLCKSGHGRQGRRPWKPVLMLRAYLGHGQLSKSVDCPICIP